MNPSATNQTATDKNGQPIQKNDQNNGKPNLDMANPKVQEDLFNYLRSRGTVQTATAPEFQAIVKEWLDDVNTSGRPNLVNGQNASNPQ